MDVLFTSSTEESIGGKASATYYTMGQLLNKELSDKNYGNGLSEGFLMFVIKRPRNQGVNASERVMYKKKTKELDMRLEVDFESYKHGDKAIRKKYTTACPDYLI